MERITRALELAYAERETRREPARQEAKIAVIAQHSIAAGEPVDFTDTVTFRSPVFELTAEARERERILPPNAGGQHGGAYKMLRTQVLHRLDQLGANTLAIVSSAPGVGKTLTAINLAIAIAAEAGRTALLVDFDLRNPSIARRFGYQPEIGVEECLQQRRPVQEAMFKIAGYERLTVLPARGRLEHSSELLSSSRAAELVAEMRTRYANRILIFDVPPVLFADDVLAFARCVQAGLLVIGEGKTRREDVPRTLELLRDLKFVGTVLNGSREPVATHY
ncbi:MAG TPA: CpsD/CapB family tyrosine-protein kinase [Steroidobacteraceae bacterium]